MSEQCFLCGLSPDQRKEYGASSELQLHGPKKNVRLELDDVRRRLFAVEPSMLTDLVEIASYVFAADCAVSRGGRTFPGMGSRWRRTLRLVVAVREPGKWREPGTVKALSEALEFLSDDRWLFEFVDLENPVSIQDYLNPANETAAASGDTSIVLFSGGLDSFAGAVHELNTTNRNVILVSRKVVGTIDKGQRELAAELKEIYGDRVLHVPVEAV